ncbi:5-methylthioadenosine/S-adenosylhomocysteine deaminase [Pseudomonas sp. GGS8]|uniref:amidohydrolase family protein n=1 Tax=Pseudomonas sp. GGS8 TaxID=2817892 RepID=UPI0020A1B1A9|nr:amidohydrolase family protein [Pseudomonas sp. GGS8]MCP1445066.1 5-methylthioadenosine/S-adenosylhomocysteine deaminase [Pseudomonas sp. GGS8]
MLDEVIYKGVRYLCPDTHRLAHGSLHVKGSTIFAIYSPSCPLPDGVRIADCSNFICMPGLVNAHLHPSKELYGGLMEYSPISAVLDAVHKNNELETREVQGVATLYSLMKEIRKGVTCVGVFTSRPEVDIDACKKLGVRAAINYCQSNQWIGAGARPEFKPIHSIAENFVSTKQQYQSDTLSVIPSTASELSANEELFKYLHAEAKKAGSVFSLHLHEGATQVALFKEVFGMTAVEYLHALEILDESTTLIHASCVSPADLAILQQSRCNIIHCPVSNSYVGAGTLPLASLMEGRSVGLGTDAAMVNPIGDITFDALFTVYHHGPDNLDKKPSARETLKMLTSSGARALGLKDVGELRVGFLADIAFYDSVNFSDHYLDNPISFLNMIHKENPVRVMVGGAVIFEFGEFVCHSLVDVRSTFSKFKEHVVG